MGRPIKKEYIGLPDSVYSEKVTISSAYIPGNTELSSSVEIVKQTGTGRYIVSDGTTTGEVTLVDGSNSYKLQEGEAILNVIVTDEKVEQYIPSSVALNNGGINYKVGDTVTIPDVGDIQITEVTAYDPGGVITDGTITKSTTLYTTDNAGSNIAGTQGSGSGVTFNVTTTEKTGYVPSGATIASGGEGYALGDTIYLEDVGTFEVQVISTGVAGGQILTGTVTKITTPSTTDMSTDGVFATGGTGKDANFYVSSKETTTYLPSSISLNDAGKGYKVGDTVTITNAGVITVTAIGTDGAISTFTTALSKTSQTTDMAGTGIAGASTSGSGTLSTFNVTSTATKLYTPDTVIITSNGTGYSVGDVLTIPNVGTYKVDTVSVYVPAGIISSVVPTLVTSPSATNMAGSSVSPTSTTSVSGKGVTLNVTSTEKNIYPIDSIAVDIAGTGYKVGDSIIIGDSLGTYKVTKVSTATEEGTVLSFTVQLSTVTEATDMEGKNIATTGGSGTGLTVDVEASVIQVSVTEYARKLNDRTVVTYENNVYTWNMENTGESTIL